MKVKILLLEGKRTESSFFFQGLVKKGFLVEKVPNGSAARTALERVMPHVVVVNAPSMGTSGKRICQSLREGNPRLPILLIVDKPVSKDEKMDVNAVIVLPFTLHKLVNRMHPFLPAAEEGEIIQVGPLQLDPEQRLVRCLDRHARLTPRLVVMLKVFMEHPGQLIDRKTLFRQVWDTDYTMDTRTLDVHISWLRTAIEADPRKPRFLKTIRGLGYRLDIEPPTRPLLRPPAGQVESELAPYTTPDEEK